MQSKFSTRKVTGEQERVGDGLMYTVFHHKADT